jgi:uncharacterized membrane-anchored protein YhcB (DUF1043 family)
MDMTPQTAWLLAISAVVIVGVVAFFVGRGTAGTKARIEELEVELARKRDEAERYRKEVDAHFDKTATLFVSMAGSYKELFEHLSVGYDTLSGASARERFQARVDALLPGRALAPAAGALLAGAGEVMPPAGDPAVEAAPVTVADAAPALEPRAEAASDAVAPSAETAVEAPAGEVETAAAEPSVAPAEAWVPAVAADADAAERVRRAEGAAAEAAAGEPTAERRGEVR